MITIRKSQDRGHANYGWLDTRHTFSFNTFYDPEFTEFRDLRVINEDRVTKGQGFGTHGHRDMEIISYVVEGSLAHKDSTGGEEVIEKNEIQRMTAGKGIEHSEFNPSKTEAVHFLQIWIKPDRKELEPGYQQRSFSKNEKLNRLRLVVSPDGREESLTINQDVSIYASVLEETKSLSSTLNTGRYGMIQLISGSLLVNGEVVEKGDGVFIEDEEILELEATAEAEFLLFDLK